MTKRHSAIECYKHERDLEQKRPTLEPPPPIKSPRHSRMSSDKAEPEQTQPAVEEELEEAKRFFALKKWNEAADAYAQVLELL
jgi:hypothetical protein